VWTDTPAFPDGNTALYVDRDDRLWLFWPLVIANTWESCITKYRVSSDYHDTDPPKWEWQDVVPLAPKDLPAKLHEALDARIKALTPEQRRDEAAMKRLRGFRERFDDKLYNRLGWQTRCKPTRLPAGRVLLPLYSDTYLASIMAISDDDGKTWYASEPLIGLGNIQPTVLRRRDGTLVAYMREAGPLERIRVSESKDDGLTWGAVGITDFPNPGSGLDGLVLASGKWLLVYNDSTRHRHSLAVSLSPDEGRTWPWTRHLEKHETGAYHYPAVIQGRDDTIHAVYSCFVKGGKSMKHAAFNEAWVMIDDD